VRVKDHSLSLAGLTLALLATSAPVIAAGQTPSEHRKMERGMSSTITLGQRRLAYAKSGSGSAVILIHGIGGHKEDWADNPHAFDVAVVAFLRR